MTTRTMYDSVNPSSVPADSTMVAGYVDGRYANVGELRTRFPHALIVRITVTGSTLAAQVADVETGDLSPTSGAAWAKKKIAAGQHPTLYCNSSTWPAVKAAVHAAGIDSAKVSYWIADYDGIAQIPAGAVAKQYLGDHPNGRGGTYDKSIVAAYWPGIDPAPKPTPAPSPAPPIVEEEAVKVIRIRGTAPQFVTNGVTRRWIEDPAERNELIAAGVIDTQVHDLSAATVHAIPLVGKAPA